MNSEQKMNAGVKIASAVLLVAVVTAAGVGLLVQHRKLREQRQAREHLERTNQQLVASRDEHVSANKELAGELYKLRDAERARETKVGELEIAVAVDEKVLRLQIAVEDAVLVAERDALEKLIEEIL